MGGGGGCCGSGPGEPGGLPDDPERIVDRVRERHGRIADGGACGCGAAGESATALAIGYAKGDLADLPAGTNLGLGCGAPVEALDPRPGETVLDLGSGAGVDALIAARRVGPSGRVIGVDMTPAMVAKARAHAARAGLSHVEFREGRLERLPVEDASVDAVTSNCVINLVPDKRAVFREIARVLKPGGRLVISDVVLDGRLPDALGRDLLAYVGCVAGATERDAYFRGVRDAGLGEIRVLRDVDFLATGACALPDDLLASLAREGVTARDLEGKVRSVTFRAVKPA